MGMALICIISSQVRSSLDKFSDRSGSIDTAASCILVDIRLEVVVPRDLVLVRLLNVVFVSLRIRFAVAASDTQVIRQRNSFCGLPLKAKPTDARLLAGK